MRWNLSNMPSQRGRTVVITGTGGLALEDALAFATAGATVVLAGRNPAKGMHAMTEVLRRAPSAVVHFEPLDLADLASIAAFGARMQAQFRSVDILINNAAVMAPPQRTLTSDGFELQLGTNFLGHVALTAHLLPLLRRSRHARVVTLSSVASRSGRIDFDDLQAVKKYDPMAVYSQSKLACLMFARELHRRSSAHGWGITSVAAHPGISRTDLIPNGYGAWSLQGMIRRYAWFLFQPAAQGALPTLYAATAPDVDGGAYYGPNRLSETRGYPAIAKTPAQALDDAVAMRLWDLSVQLTGAPFPLHSP